MLFRNIFILALVALLSLSREVDSFNLSPTVRVVRPATTVVNLSRRFLICRKTSSLSQSSSENNSSKNKDNKQRKFPSRSIALGVAVALSSVALSFHPSVSNAADAATGWLASVAETGFYQAFSLVFLSEIGDKTFFIAGLLAMKTSRFISFLGSLGALAAMTIVSVVIGQVFHAVPSGFADGIPLDDIAAVVAFAFFGLKTLKEAFEMEGESAVNDELAEAEEESNSFGLQTSAWGNVVSIFALVFAAEFGDRSFLSTIALSAAQNPVSVAGGAIAAHALATGIAVAGGSYVAKYISERVIGFIGGTLFLVFAVTTALGLF